MQKLLKVIVTDSAGNDHIFLETDEEEINVYIDSPIPHVIIRTFKPKGFGVFHFTLESTHYFPGLRCMTVIYEGLPNATP